MKEKLQFIHVILGVPTSKMAEVSGVSFGTMQRIVSGLNYEPKNQKIVAKIEAYLSKFNFPDVINVPKFDINEQLDALHVGEHVEVTKEFNASKIACQKSRKNKLFARIEENGNIIIRRIK